MGLVCESHGTIVICLHWQKVAIFCKDAQGKLGRGMRIFGWAILDSNLRPQSYDIYYPSSHHQFESIILFLTDIVALNRIFAI